MNDVEQLDLNWQTFTRLVARSERLARRGRLEQSAVAAMTAATFAWCNPTGVFASGRLEEVLARLAAGLDPPPMRRTTDRATRPRVLHVTTQLYATGGHTQMLANWLRLDTDRDHHVVVTGQGDRPVPEKITMALERGLLTILDRSHRGLLQRAVCLRSLSLDVDHVVLHVHPNDVVAAVALTLPASQRPEVMLVNHADHVFWVGASAADRVVNLRLSGARLNVGRRGVPEARNAVLVRPLHLREREMTRLEAKCRLGIAPSSVVVVSAADTYKYGAAPGAGLLDVLQPVMSACPRAQLHVAGPTPDGEWRVLADQGLGRAWGLLPDVRTLMEAADVYVDSYPFSSLTSMLEAASLDTPVLTLREADDRLGVLGADTPELDDFLVVATSGDQLAAELTRLIVTPPLREQLGRATGGAVRRFHANGAWEDQLGKVFDAPGVTGPRCAPANVPRETGPLDRRLIHVVKNSVGQGLTGTLDVMAPELSWLGRLTTAARLARSGRLRLSLLVPSRWARVVKAVLSSPSPVSSGVASRRPGRA